MHFLTSFKVMIYALLVIITLFNSYKVIKELVYPQTPSIKVYERRLRDIDFPILIKICLTDNDNSKYEAFGYQNVHKFFRGQSDHNSSLIGWSGHSKDGKIISTPSDKN